MTSIINTVNASVNASVNVETGGICVPNVVPSGYRLLSTQQLDSGKKIIDYLLKTSKKLRNRVGGKLNKTKKRIIKGGNEGMRCVIAVVAFLIACCCTGIGCIVCGPMLVGLFCLGIGAEICGAISNAFSSTSVSVGKPGEKEKTPENRKGGKTKRRRRHK